MRGLGETGRLIIRAIQMTLSPYKYAICDVANLAEVRYEGLICDKFENPFDQCHTPRVSDWKFGTCHLFRQPKGAGQGQATTSSQDSSYGVSAIAEFLGYVRMSTAHTWSTTLRVCRSAFPMNTERVIHWSAGDAVSKTGLVRK
jgi:hypothetical protein